jgi:phenylacetate-CoA ligase
MAQTLMASVRGYQLKRRRYGPDTEKLVGAALERERWIPSQWQRWRDERLQYLLHRARTHVPFYRKYWDDLGGSGSPGDWTELRNWPILEKSDIRKTPRDFVADDCNVGTMVHEHTSGTSGTPLHLWWSRDTERAWYALFEARWRRWYGVSSSDRWGILGGQLAVPFSRRRPPFWVWNAPMRQLYLSSYHLAPDFIPAYLSAIGRYGVQYLYGYTSSLYALAEEANRRNLQVPLGVVIANAEPVYPYQREAIRQAFGCPVRETYGMSELVAAASECERGRLHLWPEVGVTEILDGRLIATGLINVDQPLIRYAVGDRVTMPTADVPCGCGRTLPTISAIEGRDDDTLIAADGRRVGRLDPAFKSDLPIREAQIIQESLEGIRVKYVPAPGFGPDHARELTEALRQRLGDLVITLEAVDEVPRTANGKFRAVICALSTAERARAGLP